MESLFVECAVRAALIAVVTAAVLRTIGIKPAAARHTAWTSVMLTMLLLPIWTAWGPKTPIPLLPPVEWHRSIETPLQNEFTKMPEGVSWKEFRKVMSPLGNSQPEEIANIAIFVASDACRYMTGSIVSVDGGLTT